MLSLINNILYRKVAVCSAFLSSGAHVVHLGFVHTLHVGRGDAGAGQSLPWVFLITLQDLTLQIPTDRLDVKTSKTIVRLLSALLKTLSCHFVKL